MPEFEMQPQQQDNWCWAAVAVSIRNYLDPASEPMTQGALANQVLAPSIPPGVDCSKTPEKCDLPASLKDVFTKTGNLQDYHENAVPDFASLKKWLDLNLPVCAQIGWFEGGAHAIALDGYIEFTSELQIVSVQDPLYGPSFHFYDNLWTNYLAQGCWTDTFTAKR